MQTVSDQTTEGRPEAAVLLQGFGKPRLAAHLALSPLESHPRSPKSWSACNLQEGRFEEAALLRARQVELVEALTAAVDAGPRLPRVHT